MDHLWPQQFSASSPKGSLKALLGPLNGLRLGTPGMCRSRHIGFGARRLHTPDRGAPPHLVRSTLGHASLSTTSRYLHARPGIAPPRPCGPGRAGTPCRPPWPDRSADADRPTQRGSRFRRGTATRCTQCRGFSGEREQSTARVSLNHVRGTCRCRKSHPGWCWFVDRVISCPNVQGSHVLQCSARVGAWVTRLA
jgi:hypothetical protein